MIKAVIFDFDHTLYDREGTYTNLVSDYERVFAGKLNKNLSREELWAALCRIDHECMKESTTDWPDIFKAQVKEGLFAVPPTEEEFIRMIYTYYPGAIKLFFNTVDMLEGFRAKGYKVGILTNGEHKFQYDKISACGLVPHCDAVVTSGQVGRDKPHPYMFRAICRELNIKPEECVFVGDNPGTDICGSRGVGMVPVWVRYNPEWPEFFKRPDYEVNNISELDAIVAEIAAKNR